MISQKNHFIDFSFQQSNDCLVHRSELYYAQEQNKMLLKILADFN